MALTQAKKNQLMAQRDELEAILGRGVSSAMVDGKSVTYDLDACRRQLRAINSQLNPGRRPRASSIYLGGF